MASPEKKAPTQEELKEAYFKTKSETETRLGATEAKKKMSELYAGFNNKAGLLRTSILELGTGKVEGPQKIEKIANAASALEDLYSNLTQLASLKKVPGFGETPGFLDTFDNLTAEYFPLEDIIVKQIGGEARVKNLELQRVISEIEKSVKSGTPMSNDQYDVLKSAIQGNKKLETILKIFDHGQAPDEALNNTKLYHTLTTIMEDNLVSDKKRVSAILDASKEMAA